jgi:glycerophosphoryl diester phosphodiesterase
MRRLAGPVVATSMGMGEVAALWWASRLGRRGYQPPEGAVAAQVPPRYAGVPLVDRRFIAYARRFGLQTHVWTVDDAARVRYFLDLGVDGIMTDHVEVLRDVYTERGLWVA